MASNHPEQNHKHGSMSTRDHEKTFAGFIRVSVWAVAISVSILIFLALANS